jgi:hypothetical protein
MKFFASLFLLVLLMFQSLGYFLVFKLRQNEIRQEIKQQLLAGIPDNKLFLLKIHDSLTRQPNQQFQWIHNGEFRYHGQMYDIARSIRLDGETWFYCIADTKETQLVADLEKQIKHEMEKRRNGNNQHDNLQRLLTPYTLAWFHPCFINELNLTEINTPVAFSSITWTDPPDLPPPRG